MMESTIVQDYDFKLLRRLLRELLQVQLKAGGIALWQLQGKVMPIDRRIGTKQIEVFKTMLIRH